MATPQDKPLLFLLLAPDGTFEAFDIWSILHRQEGGFDLVLVDQSGGMSKIPPAIERAAVKKAVIPPDVSIGGEIGSLAAEFPHPIIAMTTDRVCPTHDHWLKRLCDPLQQGLADAATGREISAPGGNFFIIEDLKKKFPRQAVDPIPPLTIDNCAVRRETLLKNPFPGGRIHDPAATWQLFHAVSTAYAPDAMVMRHTLLSLGEVYRRSAGMGEDLAAAGKPPRLFRELFNIARETAGDFRFAFSIKKPQYLWYPFFYRPALHLGCYAGGRRRSG